MPEQPHVKIVVTAAPGGQKELSLVDVASGKRLKGGARCRPDQLDQQVRTLKGALERAGNQVSVREM